MPVMAVRRLSVSLRPEVEERIREAAESAGLSISAWIAQAAERAAIVAAGRRAIRQFEAEHGPPPEEAIEWADRVLRELDDRRHDASPDPRPRRAG